MSVQRLGPPRGARRASRRRHPETRPGRRSRGRPTRGSRYVASGSEYDPEMFTPKDHAALSGAWSWLLEVVGPAVETGSDGLIDDDLAYVSLWGFEPARVDAPVLLHGGRDRVV